jgi:hypothetical protein
MLLSGAYVTWTRLLIHSIFVLLFRPILRPFRTRGKKFGLRLDHSKIYGK